MPGFQNRNRVIVVLGMMSKEPSAGMVHIPLQYLLGLDRLGYDVYYVEAHALSPSSFFRPGNDGAEAAAAFIAGIMNRHGLGDRWAYHALHSDGKCYGLSKRQLLRLYSSAQLILNLHGATRPRDEHAATGRLVYVGTDPVDIEVELHEGSQEATAFLEPHAAFFTWGENYGRPSCRVPVSERFPFKPTRQPIVLDLWREGAVRTDTAFTTVASWRQPRKRNELRLDGEVYHWTKDLEFTKFLDLPQRTGHRFELALAGIDASHRLLLEQHGWHVRDASEISSDLDSYRAYLGESFGEFTVAKDQNVRLRSGWFSDRSAAYLAAGKPVITQETGFSEILPTGEGLFTFSTIDEAASAVENIRRDYARHSGAAHEIAREYFSYDVVLPALLRELGLRSGPASRQSSPREVGAAPSTKQEDFPTPENPRRKPAGLSADQGERLLIVNADDFGRSEGINEGVIEAHQQGIVTSASLMVRWPAAAAAAAYAKAQPSLGIGLHLDFGEWEHAGDSWVPLYDVTPRDSATAVREEIEAQLEAFRSLLGREPTHLDSHQHVHADEPLATAARQAATRLGIPLRQASATVRYCGDFYGQDRRGKPYPQAITVGRLVDIVKSVPLGVTELGCHPAARIDFESMYGSERETELRALCDPNVRGAIEREGVVLCSFAHLAPLRFSRRSRQNGS